MTHVNPFDANLAIQYGQLINVAYEMYSSDPNNLTPAASALPNGFKFIAWVQMKDFVLDSTTWRFYGLIVQRTDDPTKFVLAIRGTMNLEEWLDNLRAATLAPFGGSSQVAYGFGRIFQTMRIIEEGESTPTDTFGDVAKAAKDFTKQVADTVSKHASQAANSENAPETSNVAAIEVTGHSLGSALATLYVAKNVAAKLINVVRIYTFASPLVGNTDFVAEFSKLGVESWRIANAFDVVTYLPAIGFKHVDQLLQFNSGFSVNWDVGCWHSMTSYLHLLHPAFPLEQNCDPNAPMRNPDLPSDVS